MGELQVNPDATWIISAVEGVALNLIVVVRGAAILGLIIIIAMICILLFGAHGNSRRVEQAKSMAIYGVVFLILAVYTEDIVGFILYLFGIDGNGEVITSMSHVSHFL